MISYLKKVFFYGFKHSPIYCFMLHVHTYKCKRTYSFLRLIFLSEVLHLLMWCCKQNCPLGTVKGLSRWKGEMGWKLSGKHILALQRVTWGILPHPRHRKTDHIKTGNSTALIHQRATVHRWSPLNSRVKLKADGGLLCTEGYKQ